MSADPTYLNLMCTAVFAGQLAWLAAALFGKTPRFYGKRRATRLVGIIVIVLPLPYLLVRSVTGTGATVLGYTITFVVRIRFAQVGLCRPGRLFK